jgi:hypothetical protein
MLYRPPTTTTPTATAVRRVTGQFLAKNRLSKRARAQLAADVLAGKAVITDFTIRQLSTVCRVSPLYIAEARNKARRPDYATRLARAWQVADSDQRIQFIRRAGPERIFDATVQAIG